MFKWFTKKTVKLTDPEPYIEPLAKEPITYYSLGPTDNNRISFKMGYSSITMNKAGTQAMINLLTTAMNQLIDEDKE